MSIIFLCRSGSGQALPAPYLNRCRPYTSKETQLSYISSFTFTYSFSFLFIFNLGLYLLVNEVLLTGSEFLNIHRNIFIVSQGIYAYNVDKSLRVVIIHTSGNPIKLCSYQILQQKPHEYHHSPSSTIVSPTKNTDLHVPKCTYQKHCSSKAPNLLNLHFEPL